LGYSREKYHKPNEIATTTIFYKIDYEHLIICRDTYVYIYSNNEIYSVMNLDVLMTKKDYHQKEETYKSTTRKTTAA
jgi:hypothetical protein